LLAVDLLSELALDALGRTDEATRRPFTYPVSSAAANSEAAEGNEVFRKVVNIPPIVVGGNVGQTNYASTKAGLMGMIKTLSREWEHLKVNVNGIAFGHIDTRLTQATAGNAAGPRASRAARSGSAFSSPSSTPANRCSRWAAQRMRSTCSLRPNPTTSWARCCSKAAASAKSEHRIASEKGVLPFGTDP